MKRITIKDITFTVNYEKIITDVVMILVATGIIELLMALTKLVISLFI